MFKQFEFESNFFNEDGDAKVLTVEFEIDPVEQTVFDIVLWCDEDAKFFKWWELKAHDQCAINRFIETMFFARKPYDLTRAEIFKAEMTALANEINHRNGRAI